MPTLSRVSILLLLSLLIARSASAALVTYEFSGSLSRKDDPSGYIPQFNVEDEFSGYFSFDTDELFRSNIDSGRDVYISDSFDSEVLLNGVAFGSIFGEQVQIFDDYSGYDQFFFSSSRVYGAIPLPESMYTLFRFQLRDYSERVYDSLEFPDSLKLEDYDWHHFGITGYSSPSEIEFHVRGVVNELQIVSAPEPSTYALIGTLALVGSILRRYCIRRLKVAN